MPLNNTFTTMADGSIAQSDSQSGIRNISTFNIVIVAVIVVVLVAMLASLIYQGLAGLHSESYDVGKSLKPDRPSISSLAFKVRKSIGCKQADPETGGTTGTTSSPLQRQRTVGQEWYKLFKQCDKDNTGRIPLATFAGFMKDKALELSLKPTEATKVAEEADINGDGYVDFTEFAETMMSVRKRRFTRGLSVKISRLVTPRRQQTDAAREALDYGCCPPPMFLIALALVEIGVYFYQMDICGYHFVTTGEDNSGWSICLLDSLFAIDPKHPFQIWRYVTYMLVHWDLSTLVQNVIVQFALGMTLELAHRWRVSAIFILGSATAGLFATAMAGSSYVFIGGASGGIFALCAAHFANVTLNWNEMNHPYIHVFLVLCYLASEIFGWYKAESVSDTVYTGIGGLIAGILLGILFLRNVVKEKWEAKVQKGALILFAVFVLMSVAGIGYRAMDKSVIVSIAN